MVAHTSSYNAKHGTRTGTKDTCEGNSFKAIIVNSAHFSDGRISRINRVTDHKQKRACGPAAIILDCIIASSDARIASRAILFPPGTVVFQLDGAFSGTLRQGN